MEMIFNSGQREREKKGRTGEKRDGRKKRRREGWRGGRIEGSREGVRDGQTDRETDKWQNKGIEGWNDRQKSSLAYDSIVIDHRGVQDGRALLYVLNTQAKMK